MADGEGAIAKLKTELNLLGIEVDVSGAGGHVARVERRIQVLKERMRTHVHYLPFALSLLFLSLLVLYCVSRQNYEPSSLREWGASPRELFLGRKADAKRDFRCAFGDFVQCTVPSTDNTMRARTEDAVVLLPTGNRTGSVRVFALGTGKIVTRDHFQILPMPVSVITVLNKLAASDGIIPDPMTAVLHHTIRNYEPLVSHLPTYFTPPHHAAEDPTDTEQYRNHADIELADEAGLDPDGPVGHDEAGGVPRHNNDDSGLLLGPTNNIQAQEDRARDIGGAGGEIGNEIGGAAGCGMDKDITFWLCHSGV
jgi:hypothetical protein